MDHGPTLIEDGGEVTSSNRASLRLVGEGADVAALDAAATTGGPLHAFLLRTTLATRKTEVLWQVPVARTPDTGLMFDVDANFLVPLDGHSLRVLVGSCVEVLFQ